MKKIIIVAVFLIIACQYSLAVTVTEPEMHVAISEQTKQAASKKPQTQKNWKNLGKCKVTHYCPVCNDPANSYKSSSGKRLKPGMAACNWLPNGTRISIELK